MCEATETNAMSLALKIAVGLVVVLGLVVAALRIRKLRRDELRHYHEPINRRLLTPPPSPYTPSKGFRLLDGDVPVAVRREPSRPRLEPSREYVFSESQLPASEETLPLASRHDTQWALSRSGHRPRVSTSGARIGVIVVVVILVVGAIGYYANRHVGRTATTTTTRSTTTTTQATSSTTTTAPPTFPSSFSAIATSGTTATYDVPVDRYRVTVNGVAGPVWAVYRMGPHNTLEFQGSVAKGTLYSLVLTGPSQITLGSPSNASVSVGGSPVTFPTPTPAPLTLIFTPPAG